MSENEVLKSKNVAKKIGASCWSLGCAGFIIMVMVAVAGPKLISSRLHGNEAAAIGTLKMIHNGQLLHREKGSAEFGSLKTLGVAKLIDDVLARGTKQGYEFQCQASTAHPSSAWAATAAPAVPGTTGGRYFAIDRDGVIYFSNEAPIAVDPATCAMPAGVEVVGGR